MKHANNHQNSTIADHFFTIISMAFIVMVMAGGGCLMESAESEDIQEETAATDLYLQMQEEMDTETLIWDEDPTMPATVESPAVEDDDVGVLCVPEPYTDYDCTSSGCSGYGNVRYRTCEECNGRTVSCGSWKNTTACCG